MNTHKPTPDHRAEEHLALGQKVEELLEKEAYTAPETDKQPGDWREALLEIGLLATAIVIGLLIIATSFDSIYVLQQNPTIAWGIRAVLLLGLVIAYIRVRSLLQGVLFPSVNKEIIKTVYTIAPELLEDQSSTEEEEILLHKNALASYVLLFGFTILLVVVLLLNPALLNFAFDLLGENTIASIIIKLILINLGIGVYLSLRDLVYIYREYDHLRSMIWRLKKLGNKRHGLDLLNTALPEKHHSLIYQRLTALRRIMHIRGFIAPGDLQDQTFIHRSLTNSITNYLSASMPILGLIGTIFGLTIAIGGLESILGTALENREVFAASMGKSVEGIGTAFYTTLAGTICMLILRFYSMITKNAHQNFLVDMRNILAIEVIPRLQKDHDTPINPIKE